MTKKTKAQEPDYGDVLSRGDKATYDPDCHYAKGGD